MKWFLTIIQTTKTMRINIILFFIIYIAICTSTKISFVKPYFVSKESPAYEGLSVDWNETEDGLTCDCESCKYARCTRE